jgi:hypothetical protein
MIKLHHPVLVGNLTVSQYVLHRDGVDLAQWHVTAADGKLVLGPFSSMEEAMDAANDASSSSSESENKSKPRSSEF